MRGVQQHTNAFENGDKEWIKLKSVDQPQGGFVKRGQVLGLDLEFLIHPQAFL